jgi:CRP-like cAMP-binding protein
MTMPKTPRTDIAHTTRLGIVRDTGEVVDVEFPVARGKRRKARRKVYALMDLESLDRLELVGGEWEVLSRIMRAVNPETNIASVTHQQIADDLGMARPNVSRIIRLLRERRILFDLPGMAFRVNAHIMFRGSNVDWDLATDTEEEPQWNRA